MPTPDESRALNPYAPPGPVLAGVVENTPGPWRDGPFIVLEAHHPLLPRRCVKSGAVDDVEVDLHELQFRPDIGEDFDLKLDVPLSRGYARRRILTWTLFGLVLALLGGASIMIGMFFDSFVNPGEAEVALVAAGAFLVVCGVVVPILNLVRPPLRIRTVQGHYLWLAGANESFLTHLPPRPPRVPSFSSRPHF